MTRIFQLIATTLCLCAAVQTAAAQADVVTRARTIALAGQRLEAIALLQGALVTTPRNDEARVALGAILSWEGRFDEARRELELVLRGSPGHGDALAALINVELWSAHPEQADLLARRGLQRNPSDTGYLLLRARALVALKQPREAATVLDRLLALDPRDQQALTLRRTLTESRRIWQARAGASYDAFNDRDGQREAQISLSRATPIGPVLVRGARAERYGLDDHQVELEMYPRLRRGTYAYVAGAYSPDAVLYPRYRYAADLYQSLGAGFEGSVGYRRLSFGDGVDIYVGSLSKSHGNWLVAGRVFLTPGTAGTSKSVHASFRRYFGDQGAYLGMRYGRGAAREDLITLDDLEVLDSDAGAVEAVFPLGRRLEVHVTGWYGREDRTDRRDQQRYSMSSGLGFRF